MPTYQYACTNPECENRFELVQSFTDPAASECPVCGGPVRKLYGSVGVVFKGSGFYRTDSRSEAKSSSSAKSGSSDSGAKSETGGSSSGPKIDSSSTSSSKSSTSSSSGTTGAKASA